MRQNISSNSPFEPVIGFSRAVRVGNLVCVSGTAPWDDEGRLLQGGVYEQTARCIANIATVLQQAGASLRDVVRTRIFVTDMSRWEEVARAHREAFGDVLPASTLVEVSRLATPEMLVEIEADAVVDER